MEILLYNLVRIGSRDSYMPRKIGKQEGGRGVTFSLAGELTNQQKPDISW